MAVAGQFQTRPSRKRDEKFPLRPLASHHFGQRSEDVHRSCCLPAPPFPGNPIAAAHPGNEGRILHSAVRVKAAPLMPLCSKAASSFSRCAVSSRMRPSLSALTGVAASSSGAGPEPTVASGFAELIRAIHTTLRRRRGDFSGGVISTAYGEGVELVFVDVENRRPEKRPLLHGGGNSIGKRFRGGPAASGADPFGPVFEEWPSFAFRLSARRTPSGAALESPEVQFDDPAQIVGPFHCAA